MSFLILVPLALLVLSILVLVHEFGHYMAARMIGVWVEEFGIGLPPKIWGKKIGETEYTINALPLGGFVRLHGEDPSMKVTKPERAFKNKSKLARAFVAVAGISMNLVFASFCLSLIFWFFGTQTVNVEDIADGSPAAVSELAVGDEVLKVNDRSIRVVESFSSEVADSAGEQAIFTVNRDGQRLEIPVSINSEYVEDQGYSGILYKPNEPRHDSLIARPFTYTAYGIDEAVYWTKKTVEGFITLFSQLGSGQAPAGLAGPLGVTLTIAEILRYGIYSTLTFTAIISINLAVINLVPFPPLDGSRVLLLGVEAIVGREKVQKYETKILEIGMGILLLLILVLTITEIPKLISAGSITGFVDTLFSQ